MKAQEAQSKSNQDHYLHELVGVCPCVGGENEYKFKITLEFFRFLSNKMSLRPGYRALRRDAEARNIPLAYSAPQSQIDLTQSNPAF